jgi:L-threonylcarbamoyladenylate synthase
MHILPISDEALREALTILTSGGVVAHATETCYGLACDLTNLKAVERLFAIKQRSTDQPVSALFPSIEEAKKYAEWSEEAEVLARKHLPGPLTMILLQRSNAPAPLWTTPQSDNEQRATSQRTTTLGIRVSSHPIAMELSRRFGKPLSTTSANLHGKPNLYSAEEILSQFQGRKAQPDLILDSGKLSRTPPSTVVDLSGPKPRTKRQGRLSA